MAGDAHLVGPGDHPLLDVGSRVPRRSMGRGCHESAHHGRRGRRPVRRRRRLQPRARLDARTAPRPTVPASDSARTGNVAEALLLAITSQAAVEVRGPPGASAVPARRSARRARTGRVAALTHLQRHRGPCRLRPAHHRLRTDPGRPPPPGSSPGASPRRHRRPRRGTRRSTRVRACTGRDRAGHAHRARRPDAVPTGDPCVPAGSARPWPAMRTPTTIGCSSCSSPGEASEVGSCDWSRPRPKQRPTRATGRTWRQSFVATVFGVTFILGS